MSSLHICDIFQDVQSPLQTNEGFEDMLEVMEIHTYITENLLGGDFLPVRQELFARFSKFLKELKKSPSYEVRVLSGVVISDLQSATAVNIAILQGETGLNPTSVSSRHIRRLDLRRPVPAPDTWRLPVLSKLLSQRREQECDLQDTSDIDFVISGLCST